MSTRYRWGPTDICLIRMALRKYYDRVMLDADENGEGAVKTIVAEEMSTCGFEPMLKRFTLKRGR